MLLACYDPETETLQSLCRCMSGFSDAAYRRLTAFYRDGAAASLSHEHGDADGAANAEVEVEAEMVAETSGGDLLPHHRLVTPASLLPRERARGSWTRRRRTSSRGALFRVVFALRGMAVPRRGPHHISCAPRSLGRCRCRAAVCRAASVCGFHALCGRGDKPVQQATSVSDSGAVPCAGDATWRWPQQQQR